MKTDLQELIKTSESLISSMDEMIRNDRIFSERIASMIEEVSYEYYKTTETLKEIARSI